MVDNEVLISSRKLAIARLESKIGFIRQKIERIKKLGPVKKSNQTRKIEPNIYKKGLRFKVEMVVNGVVRLERFNSLEEAKAFKMQCLAEREKNNK